MENKADYSIGLRFGLIAFLIYSVLLFLRYNFFSGNPLTFGIFVFVSYLVILTIFFFAGLYRKKQEGGFAEFKEVFQSIFIAIVIAELGYLLFNFIYLKFIDPNFFETFKQNTRTFLENAKQPDEVIDKQMEKFKDMDEQLKPLGLLKSLGYSILIDSVFGMIFAAILRKKKDVFDTQ
jgi:hypothetical protein